MKKQLIIVGGGSSIQEGINKGLWDKLKGKFTIGTNYSYKFFDSTILCYVDKLFYENQIKELKNIPLIVGAEHRFLNPQVLPNTIMLKGSSTYKENISRGVYKPALTGLFALTLGIYLLKEGDEIYLLGYDSGEARKSDYEKFANFPQELNKIMIRDAKGRPLTHFYQGEINHRGIGKINYYNAKCRTQNDFKVYENAKVKIYNVSLNSKIPDSVFEKISYDQFFVKLNNKQICQPCLRKYIKERLK